MILTITANPAVDRAYSVAELVIGEVHRPTAMNATAGGKGLNVARVASILGAEVAAMGFIGGSNGAFIASELKKLGFRDSFTRISGETRICINIADAQGRSTELLESGPVIQPLEKRQFLQDFSANLEQSSIITASGSLPKGLDGSFYCQLVQLAREKGKPMIVDTSGAALQAVLGAKPFMVKPNRWSFPDTWAGRLPQSRICNPRCKNCTARASKSLWSPWAVTVPWPALTAASTALPLPESRSKAPSAPATVR